jgi:hypothetical protein
MRKGDKRSRNREAEYVVGYGRPPIETRFRPGESGNPKGRPKGEKNAATMAHTALERKVSVTERGTRRTMTVRELAYWRLAQKAIAGELKALAYLLSLEGHDQQLGSPLPETAPSSEEDLEIIRDFLARHTLAKRNEP